jgi:metallo-beta-lactamase class B
MKRHFATALMAAGFGLVGAAVAQVPDTVEGHVLAAQKAAGLDFPGTLDVLCIQPDDGSDPSAASRSANAGKPRPIPARETWYAEPAKVFDNVYFVGTKINNAWAIKTSEGIILLDTMYNYAAETEIIGA